MGPSKSTNSDVIDNINYGISFNVLKAANADKYLESISHEDIILKKLNNTQNSLKGESLTKFITMLANVYQSVTTRGLTTYEIVSYIVNAVNSFKKVERDEVLQLLKNYFAIFHTDYFYLNSIINLNENEKEVIQHILYRENSYPAAIYGFMEQQYKQDANNLGLYSTANFQNFGKGNNQKKYASVTGLNTNPTTPSKNTPDLSVILLNNDNLRGGVKNSLELSTFFNLIPTLEYAKAYPYFNATFVLPSVSRQDKKSIFKTATLNQFLFGGIDNQNKNSNFKKFEGEIFKDEVGIGVKTNLSVFTTPQTAVNMNEKVGHNEILSSDKKRLRITNVHDQTRPFMTLKDFTIDVSPTKGLMSFKTGKLSLILHDRTRMVDIAPFIKPDLFGAFGAEIIVEYGWSHNESQSSKTNTRKSTNPIGDFLDSSRCIEKYMIVNSQFTIENNGQVNINLSIAMKGPIDIRQTEIFADSTKSIDINILNAAIAEYNIAMNDLNKQNSTGFEFNSNTVGLMTNLTNKKRLDKKTRVKLNNQVNELKKFKSLYSLWKKNIVSLTPINSASAIGPRDFLYKTKINFNQEQKKVLSKYIQFKKLYDSLSVEEYETIKFDVYPSIEKIIKIIEANLAYDKNLREKQTEFIDDLIGGTQSHDMFFDQYLVNLLSSKSTSSVIPLKNYNYGGLTAIENVNLSDYMVEVIDYTNYISLGTIITSLISTHMVPSKKYDEIQIIFNTVNDYAGLASTYKKKVTNDDDYSLNIASLIIKRSYLQAYLEKLFESQTRLTLESLLSQIIKQFVITKDNPCYGLSDLYVRDDANSPVKPKKTTKEKDKNDRLNKIYYDNDTELYDDEPQFLLPDIHFTFDALTSRENKNLTICRITVYDRHNNPYQSIADLYNETFTENAKKFRRLQQLTKVLETKKISTKSKRATISAAKKLIKELTSGDKAVFEKVTEGGNEFYRFKTGFGFDDLKRKYKKIVPAATFSTQNTSLISASVATINEGKLNTVYITRQDRNKTNEINNQVIIDTPLRILPAQASIETFGCPWINFGQYIFLDFETGTTLDNTYAVTGLKHTISPGKFSTQVTLSYGDVYGKYEGIADGFNNALNKFVPTKKNDSKEEKTPKTKSKKIYVNPSKAKQKVIKKQLIEKTEFTIRDLLFDSSTTSSNNLNKSLEKFLNNFKISLVLNTNNKINFDNKMTFLDKEYFGKKDVKVDYSILTIKKYIDSKSKKNFTYRSSNNKNGKTNEVSLIFKDNNELNETDIYFTFLVESIDDGDSFNQLTSDLFYFKDITINIENQQEEQQAGLLSIDSKNIMLLWHLFIYSSVATRDNVFSRVSVISDEDIKKVNYLKDNTPAKLLQISKDNQLEDENNTKHYLTLFNPVNVDLKSNHAYTNYEDLLKEEAFILRAYKLNLLKYQYIFKSISEYIEMPRKVDNNLRSYKDVIKDSINLSREEFSKIESGEIVRNIIEDPTIFDTFLLNLNADILK